MKYRIYKGSNNFSFDIPELGLRWSYLANSWYVFLDVKAMTKLRLDINESQFHCLMYFKEKNNG